MDRVMTPMQKNSDPGTPMRGLGRFFGHIWGAIRTPVEGGVEAGDETTSRVEVRRETEEREEEGVTLRRTTIEEIEFRPGSGEEDPR